MNKEYTEYNHIHNALDDDEQTNEALYADNGQDTNIHTYDNDALIDHNYMDNTDVASLYDAFCEDMFVPIAIYIK